jgi:MYXO-CTERM domain-containing protein
MRPKRLLSAFTTLLCAASLGALAGCQIDDVAFDDDQLGELQQASIGALPVPALAHHRAAAAITILLPEASTETDQRPDSRYCTGVLVGPNVVMTAASCMSRNYEAQLDDQFTSEYLDDLSISVRFGLSSSDNTAYHLLDTFTAGPTSLKGLIMHRYYIKNTSGTNDVALLVLDTAVVMDEIGEVTPAELETNIVKATLEQGTLELVGYGKKDTDGDKISFTTRQVVTPDIETVTATRVTAGEAGEKTTCYADSGGPGFFDSGSGPKVATVSERHGTCDTVATRERVDLFAEGFVLPLVAFAAGCSGCTACEFNGVCEEDCATTRDLDCDVGSFTGEACDRNGDCEEGGSCVAAGDDAAFTYCSKDCTDGDDNTCPSSMACVESKCIYDGISPGSQGASCASPGDCRSSFCESLFCANECDANVPSSCDTEAGTSCLPNESGDSATTVCRLPTSSGGGGFCAVSTGGSRSGTGALGGFGLIFLLGLFLRRRR